MGKVVPNKVVNSFDVGDFGADAFGRQRVSETGQRFDVEFIYDKQPELVDEVTGGSGTATHDTNSRDITLAVNAATTADKAELYSYDIPYTPGNSQLIDITATLDYAGIGGGEAEIYFRSKVTGSVVETTYAQSTWESNNTGIDWTKSHILSCDFQSLKVGRIRFYMIRDGGPQKLVDIFNDNRKSTGYWQLPTLPLHWRLYNDATYTYAEMGYGDSENGFGLRYKIPVNANAEMKAICATVKSESGDSVQSMPGLPRCFNTGTTGITVSTAEIPIFSIRQASTFNSLTNRSVIVPESFNIVTDNDIRYKWIFGGSLTGASWVSISNSSAEYDLSATAISGGSEVACGYITTGRNVPTGAESILGKTLLWNRRGVETGIITLVAIRTGTNDADILASLSWKEIR